MSVCLGGLRELCIPLDSSKTSCDWKIAEYKEQVLKEQHV